jgi:putative transcriptional regulator
MSAPIRPIKAIRKLLGMSQAEIAEHLGCRQGNISFMERGQTVPPESARRLIELARSRGVELSYDHVYGARPVPVQHEVAA